MVATEAGWTSEETLPPEEPTRQRACRISMLSFGSCGRWRPTEPKQQALSLVYAEATIEAALQWRQACAARIPTSWLIWFYGERSV